jgi:hypothetical protein
MRHDSRREGDADARPTLPTLRPGVRLLDSPDVPRRRAIRTVQTLVLDHLLCNRGYVEWVDADGHASTQSMARLAPSERFLDRVRVARAFTPHQHASLVGTLTDRVGDRTALVVCPALDHPYRDEDCRETEGVSLLLRALARLSTVARTHDVPVLVTRTAADAFAEPVAAAAAERIAYEETRYGPRFSGGAVETLVYPVGHGQLQTTLAFWRRVLADRRSLHARSGDRDPLPASAG